MRYRSVPVPAHPCYLRVAYCNTRQDDREKRGTPKTGKTAFLAEQNFFWFKSGFEVPRPRETQPWWRNPIWSSLGDRHFWGPGWPIFGQSPHPYCGLCLHRAACHAILWTASRPQLRWEVVGALPEAKYAPEPSFSRFWGAPCASPSSWLVLKSACGV